MMCKAASNCINSCLTRGSSYHLIVCWAYHLIVGLVTRFHPSFEEQISRGLVANVEELPWIRTKEPFRRRPRRPASEPTETSGSAAK